MFRKMPIRRKLMLISAGSVLVVSAVIGLMAVMFHTKVLNEQIKDSGADMAYTLEMSVKQPLLANDVVTVDKIANAFSKPFYVLMDVIYRGDGSVVAYSPKDESALKVLEPEFKKMMDQPGDVHIVKMSLSKPLESKGTSYYSVFILHRKLYQDVSATSFW